MSIANLSGLAIEPLSVRAQSITLETTAGLTGGTISAPAASSLLVNTGTVSVGSSSTVNPILQVSGTKGLSRVYDPIYFPPDGASEVIIPGDQNVSTGNTNLAVFTLVGGVTYQLDAWMQVAFATAGATVQLQFSLSAGTASGYMQSNNILNGNPVTAPMGWFTGLNTYTASATFTGTVLTWAAGAGLNMHKIEAILYPTVNCTLTVFVTAGLGGGADIPISNMVTKLTGYP